MFVDMSVKHKNQNTWLWVSMSLMMDKQWEKGLWGCVVAVVNGVEIVAGVVPTLMPKRVLNVAR